MIPLLNLLVNQQIMTDELNDASNKRVDIESKLGIEVKKRYLELCFEWSKKYEILWKNLSKFIAELDVIRSHSKIF